MRKIKFKDGPLKGTTQLVHENVETFTTHADPNGHYEVTAQGARWVKHKATN